MGAARGHLVRDKGEQENVLFPENVRKQKFFSLSPELSRPQHEDGHDQGVPVRGLDQGIRARCTDCMIDKTIGKKGKRI